MSTVAANVVPSTTAQRADQAPPRRPVRVVARLSVLAFGLSVATVLLLGWFAREDSYLTAEEGLGYGLGIAGGLAMLALLLYPLRKRIRFMRNLGSVKYWFKTHMLLGVLGPSMILFHANFTLGSPNSNLALFSMLLVAASGLFGRYFYARIHHGLYGARATLKELRSELHINKGKLTDRFKLSAPLAERLQRFETAALRSRPFAFGLLWLIILPLRAIWTYMSTVRSIKRDLRKQAARRQWDRQMLGVFEHDASRTVREYIATVRQAAELGIYARLFSLWHLLHMPLFLVLVVTGIVHVIAVHLY